MRKALWLGRGIAGMGNIPILGVKKKVEPVEPEPAEPTDPSTPSTVEPMLVTPASADVLISSVSDLEIDWGDGTVQTVKSGDDLSFIGYGVTCNKYAHTYTDSFEDKVISIKHLDGKSPIQFLSSIYLKTVQRWYSEGYQPIHFFNEFAGFDQEMTFYSLGIVLDAVPNTAPPKTTHLTGMFASSTVFNQDISMWDVSNVTDLAFTFTDTKAFNQPLAAWDVSNVTNMYGTFGDAIKFNQDISSWDVSNVTNMDGMFYNTPSFNQDLSGWCVPKITSEPPQFADGSLLSVAHKPVWGTCPSDEDTIPDPVPEPIVDPIHNLFANNEQGFFYDPNDLSTMFQDAEGTVPVTASGQPVGLILDKSGNNNHAFQSNSASRPIFHQIPILGNELVVNGDFSNGLDGWQSRSTSAEVRDGKALVTYNGGGGLFQDVPATEGKMYKVSYKFERHGGSSDLAMRVYGSEDFSNLLGSSSLSYVQYFYVTAVSSSIRVYLHKGSYGIASWDDVSVKEVAGYHNDKNYLVFDGVDDFLQTSNIDFTSTNNVSLFAGVRKLSDAKRSMLFEFGTTADKGSFRFEPTMTNGSNGMYFGSSSTMQVISRLDLSAPASFVATMYGDVGTNSTYLKVNNVVSDSSRADKTSVNYGNLTMHIGRRGGTELPFNGHLYSLIGIGRLTTEVEREDAEKELAERVGVSLNV